MRCLQCGHPHPSHLGKDRYSCRSCEAVFRAVPAELPAVDGDPLSAYLPARMVRWVRAQDGPDTPDRETISRWYKEFDALVAKARSHQDAQAAFDEVSEVPLDRLPAKPPPFSKVCAALHATCYDVQLAAARLGTDDPMVAERVGHLRRWLAGPGRATTWPAAPPAAEPAPEAVKDLVPLPETFTGDQVRAFFAALFQVDKGPSVPGVLDRFGKEQVEQALLAYLHTGARPLRDAVLADLDAG